MYKREQPHFLSFTRKEKNGIVVMLLLIVLVRMLPWLRNELFPEKIPAAAELKQHLTSITWKPVDSANRYKRNDYAPSSTKNYESYSKKDHDAPAHFFYFDPNTISAEGWKKLGVKEKTIASIQKYLSKGGRFRKPEDIKKIWGIPAPHADRLLPYVAIKTTAEENRSYPPYNKEVFKKREPSSIDINQADSMMLEALPGIGPKLAQRIILYRNKLGGFHSIHQVSETFGLPDSTFQRIQPLLVIGASGVQPININTADLAALKAHPYIRHQLANALIQYRQQHGSFVSVQDLKKIMLVDDVLFNKLLPYVTVD